MQKHNPESKQVSFPVELYLAVEEKAKGFGISTDEYLRHLVIRGVESVPIEYLDEETEAKLTHSVNEFRKGNTITVDPNKPGELEEFLDLK